MPSTFARAVHDYRTTTPGHAAGAATLALATGTGAGLGTLPAGRIFRVTALSGPGTTSEAILGVFEATGISGDTLTGVAGAEGFGNVALPAGATVEVRMTAQDYEDHSAAINALETTVDALAPPSGSLTALQIQALIDARAGTGKAVVLPAGTHYLDRPLRISQPLTTLVGDPGGGTVLSSLQAGGMPTIHIGPVLSPAPVLFDGQMSRWVNLRDTRSGDIDGLTTLTIRFDFDLAALPPADESQVILSSGGARKEFGEYTESLRIDIFNGNLRAKFTTASGQVTLATPITTGPHLIELVYDGSAVALRVDGSGPSVAATGPVSQGFYEDFVLGSSLARWPDGLCWFYPAVGTMTDFFMDGSGVGNPLFQIPSFATADQLIPCETRYGAATLLLKKDGDGSASIQHCRVADLQVVANHGHGIFMTQTQASILERLQLTGRQPLTMWNNAYVDSVRDLHCYGWSAGARYGMAMIGGTCNEARNINVSLAGPGVGIVAVAASSNFDRCYVIGGQMKLGLLCKATGSGRWSNSIVTDEDQSVPGEAALLFSGVDAVLVDGGGSYALSSPHPVAILDNCKAATFVGHQLGATATTPELFSVAACGPVAVESCPVVPAGVPYGAGVTIVPGSVAIGDAVSGGTAGRVLFEGEGPTLADDDDLIWDPASRLLNVGATAAGRVYVGPMPGFPSFGGVWTGVTPGTTNFSLLGDGSQTIINDASQIHFRISNTTVVHSKIYGISVGYQADAAANQLPANTSLLAFSPGVDWTPLIVRGFAGQTAPLTRWLASDGTTVLASVGPAGTFAAAALTVAGGAVVGSFAADPGLEVRGKGPANPVMTSNTTPSPAVASASSEINGGNQAWNAFDSALATRWISGGGPPQTLRLDLGAGGGVVSQGYAITAADSAAEAPNAWTFEASDDGSTWTVLDTQAGLTWTVNQTRIFTYINSTNYRHHRLVVSAVNGGANVRLSQLNVLSLQALLTVASTGWSLANLPATMAGSLAVGTTLTAGGNLTVAGTGMIGGVGIAPFLGGTFLTMSAAGPSGIGTGTANPWIAYVASDGQWLADSVAGDVACRNTAGNILFGTSGAPASFAITAGGVVATAPAADKVALRARGATAQSADIARVEGVTGTVYLAVGPTGVVTIGTLSGLLLATAGVVSVGVAGTDYLTPTGSGAGLTALNASALAAGTVPMARLPGANGRLASTVTTTSSTLGTNALTNLGFAIGANEAWTGEWNLTVTGSTAGMKFDVTGPASPTDLRISILGNTSAITATSAETITAFSSASAAYVTYATTSGQVRVVACINNGANAGTVQLRFGSATNTQSNSVLLNSYMTARRIG